MTALKLVDEYILQVDPTVCGLPAFTQDSKLLFGSGYWSRIPRTYVLRIEHLIISWQRIARDAFWNSSPSTDEEFRAKWMLPTLTLRLAKNRLLAAY